MKSDNLTKIAGEAESGGVRAAVLGVNDGLVTNLSLTLGVAAGSANVEIVKLAGVASLIAGACSMAVGEYISMQAQVELLQSVLKSVRHAFVTDAARNAGLRVAFRRQGLSPEVAAIAARDLDSDDERAVALYSRTVLGINPSELGSPWIAAAASLVTFAFGALVPLVPWYVFAPPAATSVSLALSVATAFIIGACLGHYTNGNVLRGGIRQTIVIAISAGVTYAGGRLFHVVVK